MARSIHDTWGELARARQEDWSDPEARDAEIAELRANVRRQYAVRSSERQLRRHGPTDPHPVDVERLPILVDDEAPFVFHAIGADDIREILRGLPAGSLDGLQAIRLLVDRRDGDRSWPRDPFTGRHRREMLPGVYISGVLGRYLRTSATVLVHAFLCELPAVAPFVAWLRLNALHTLLHELAHHFDWTFRVGRSRWDLRDKAKSEAWAGRLGGDEHDSLARRHVRDRYPDECQRLQTWFETALGVELPSVIDLIEGDDPALVHAFRQLVRDVHAGGDLAAARITFAQQLHRSGINDAARAILGAVLAGDPAHPRALALAGCLALCGERDYDRCLASCRLALDHAPGCADAHETVVRCHATAERWQDAADACERALPHLAADEPCSPYVLRTLVEARLLLDDANGVAAALAQMRARSTGSLARRADVYELIALCWREQWEPAFVRASRMLAGLGRDEPWLENLLTAVRFAAARALGRSVPDLGDATLERLESHPLTHAWAARLRALG